MLIAGAVECLGNKLPHGIEINPQEKRVNLFPDHVKEIRQLMEYVQLDGIYFREDGFELLLSLK